MTGYDKVRKGYKWEVLALLWVAYLLNQADRQVFNVVLPLIREDLGLSDVAVGTIATVFNLFYAVLVPIGGFIGDRFSRKWIVTASVLLAGCRIGACHRHAGHRSLKRHRNGLRLSVEDRSAVDAAERSGQVFLLDGAIADNHYLVEQVIVLLEHYRNRGVALRERNSLRFVSDAADRKRGSLGRFLLQAAARNGIKPTVAKSIFIGIATSKLLFSRM